MRALYAEPPQHSRRACPASGADVSRGDSLEGPARSTTGGLKFRRQHPIGPFVADFCCPERRLVVELDGGVHATQVEADADREALLAAAGYSVVRFANEAVTPDLLSVLATIRAAAEAQPPREGTPPLRAGRF